MTSEPAWPSAGDIRSPPSSRQALFPHNRLHTAVDLNGDALAQGVNISAPCRAIHGRRLRRVAGRELMKSVCSNCGGKLVHGNALGACTRCGHALTGALWTVAPKSTRRGPAGPNKEASRLGTQVA